MNPLNKFTVPAERQQYDFVANVSHELRTPLTVIHGYLESLMHITVRDPKKLQKIFQQMFQHSARMAHTIDDLILLSKLENETASFNEETVNVADLLRQLHSEAKNISGHKQHNIHLAIQSTAQLKGSTHEVYSLFSNLIINAIKYTPAHGHIHIEWHQDKNHRGIFCVKDTGVGIKKKYIPHLTERFFRIEQTSSDENQGTGLGLAIAKKILLRHQGELHVASQWKKGSAFSCIFPADRMISTWSNVKNS